jgi:Flp pilus assembly protein TadB
MTSGSQDPRQTEVRESDIELKWKIRFFWIVFCGDLAVAVLVLSLRSGLPHRRTLGFLNLGVAVLVLAVINKLRKRRIEIQSEVEGLEGDGGRQRT